MKVRAAIAAILAAAALAPAWRIAEPAVGLDFYQFWAGAQIARSAENLYSEETRTQTAVAYLDRSFDERSPRFTAAARSRAAFEFFSTPFLYTTFGVLPHRYDPAVAVYRVMLIAAFVGGVLLLARAVALSWASAALLVAFGLVLFQPMASELRVLNVNSLQLAAIGLALWLTRERTRWRCVAAGALLAMVTAFKPNLAAVVPLLLAWRFISNDRDRLRWEAAGAAAGAAAAVVVSSIYFRDAGAWVEWLDAARALASSVLGVRDGNVAPFATAGAATYAVAAVLVALIAAALWIRRNVGGDDITMLVVGLALLVYLISATLVWLHYLILALPAAIALIADRTSAIRRVLGLLGLTLTGFDVWMHVLNIRTLGGQSRVLWLGMAVLFVTSLWRVWDIRTVVPAAASYGTDERRRPRTRPRTPRAVR